ncbi:MAG TPA: hypothetical protein VFO77_05465, partial [Actinoplanes sp.]|nr:hypothetical protein [Actinoplanes sp.]
MRSRSDDDSERAAQTGRSRRLFGRGKQEPAEPEPVPREETGWLDDLRTAKEQRAAIGPGTPDGEAKTSKSGRTAPGPRDDDAPSAAPRRPVTDRQTGKGAPRPGAGVPVTGPPPAAPNPPARPPAGGFGPRPVSGPAAAPAGGSGVQGGPGGTPVGGRGVPVAGRPRSWHEDRTGQPPPDRGQTRRPIDRGAVGGPPAAPVSSTPIVPLSGNAPEPPPPGASARPAEAGPGKVRPGAPRPDAAPPGAHPTAGRATPVAPTSARPMSGPPTPPPTSA